MVTIPIKRKLSDDHKRKISEAETGEKHWNYGHHWSEPVLEKMRISHLAPREGEFKRCSKCNMLLPLSKFKKSYTKSGRHRATCTVCENKRMREYKHCVGAQRPMDEAKDSTVYLGVHIAEKALSGFFDNIERMPYGNKGFDFYCGKKLKIDVKSSCLHDGARNNRNGYWKFQIKYNTITDYFLCIAFDSRENLEPVHVWLIPGALVSTKKTLNISDSEMALQKWAKYERPLGKVIACCQKMRGVV